MRLLLLSLPVCAGISGLIGYCSTRDRWHQGERPPLDFEREDKSHLGWMLVDGGRHSIVVICRNGAANSQTLALDFRKDGVIADIIDDGGRPTEAIKLKYGSSEIAIYDADATIWRGRLFGDEFSRFLAKLRAKNKGDLRYDVRRISGELRIDLRESDPTKEER